MQWVINIGTNYLRFFASMVAVFFMTPYVIDKLGVEQFGLWTLIYSLAGLFGLMDFGFATAAVKYVAEATGANDIDARNSTLATLLLIYLAIGGACLALVLLLAGPSSGWFELETGQRELFKPVLWLLGLAVALNFPASLFKACMSGAGRMDIVNAFDLLMVLVNVSLTYLLLEAGLGMTGLALSTAITLIGTSLAMIPLAYRILPGFSVSWRLASRAQIKPLLSFSSYAFLANIALLISLRLDPVVIKLFMPLSAIALYAIAVKISEYVYLLNKQFSNALMPLISQLHGSGDGNSIRRIMVDGTRLLLAVALPGIALLYHYAAALIQLWLGPDFADSAPLLRILLLALLPVMLQLNAANVLGMTGQHRFLARCMLGSALLNVIISMIGVALIGLPGAAIGTLISVLAVEFTLVLPTACRHIDSTVPQFLRQTVLPALPALLPMAATIWLLEQITPSPNLGLLALHMLLGGLVYLLAFSATGLTRAERSWLVTKLQGSKTTLAVHQENP
jgi:O-antigen/teichoic acid export membrane protein